MRKAAQEKNKKSIRYLCKNILKIFGKIFKKTLDKRRPLIYNISDKKQTCRKAVTQSEEPKVLTHYGRLVASMMCSVCVDTE